MRLIYVLSMMLVAGVAQAAPALVVENAGGKTLVRAVSGKLAAWRPEADALVVVIPAGSGEVEIETLAGGVTAEKVSNGGLTGVVVRGVDGSWQVVQDGANWLIRPGSGLKADSVMMLRDGWRVGGRVVAPQSFNALGKQWQVGLVDSARSVAGSVAGVVKLGGGVAVSDKVDGMPLPVAKVEETKMVEAQPVAMKMVAPAVQDAAPVLKPLAVGGGDKVYVGKAESLRPVALPALAASALPVRQSDPAQGMKLVAMDAMLARIEPASGPAPVVPRNLPVQAAGVLPGEAVRIQPASGLGKVSLTPGSALRPIGSGKVAEDLLPQMLGEVYQPGTLVSLTLPKVGDEHSAHEEPVHGTVKEMVDAAHGVSPAAIISNTAMVSRTWNQVTLAPLEAAMAAKNVSPVDVAEPEETHAATKAVPEEPVKDADASRLLPAREGEYQEEVAYRLQAIAEAPEDSTRERDARMGLAGFYIAWQRPEEALGVLGALPKRNDGLPASPQARLYMAVAQLARGMQPSKGLLDQGGLLAAHGKLWQAVAASRRGDFAGALEGWPQERGILPQYPAYLREMAQLAQAHALVMVGDRKVARDVIDKLREGYADGGRIPVGLTRLAGLVRLGTPDEQEGLELLAKAAEDMRDPAEAYRAKFQFVRALQQRRDLSDDQVRTYLTDLWFDWRGDELERDVLDMLGDLYDKAGEPRQALQYWQTLVKAYPSNPELGRITERMTDAFLKVFDPENPKIYDTLEYVGLYYDFSELVPNDGRGDLVQEQVARLLVQANLYDRAAPILEQQLEHRPLDAAAQGRLVLLLAEVYRETGQAAEGIKLLDKWQSVAGTTVLGRNWKLEEARLMLELKRPDAAAKALASLPEDDREARGLRIEAAWQAKDWMKSIPLLQGQLAGVTAAQLVSDTAAQLAAFRLSYAYGQMKDADELGAMAKRYESGLEKLPQLADDIGVVAAGTGISASVVAAGPLAPLTTALNDLNRLTDRVQLTRATIAQEQEEQREYNDKMRYMELLPPPAL